MKTTYKDFEPYMNKEDKNEYLKSLLIQREEKRIQEEKIGRLQVIGLCLFIAVFVLLMAIFM